MREFGRGKYYNKNLDTICRNYKDVLKSLDLDNQDLIYNISTITEMANSELLALDEIINKEDIKASYIKLLEYYKNEIHRFNIIADNVEEINCDKYDLNLQISRFKTALTGMDSFNVYYEVNKDRYINTLSIELIEDGFSFAISELAGTTDLSSEIQLSIPTEQSNNKKLKVRFLTDNDEEIVYVLDLKTGEKLVCHNFEDLKICIEEINFKI